MHIYADWGVPRFLDRPLDERGSRPWQRPPTRTHTTVTGTAGTGLATGASFMPTIACRLRVRIRVDLAVGIVRRLAVTLSPWLSGIRLRLRPAPGIRPGFRPGLGCRVSPTGPPITGRPHTTTKPSRQRRLHRIMQPLRRIPILDDTISQQIPRPRMISSQPLDQRRQMRIRRRSQLRMHMGGKPPQHPIDLLHRISTNDTGGDRSAIAASKSVAHPAGLVMAPTLPRAPLPRDPKSPLLSTPASPFPIIGDTQAK